MSVYRFRKEELESQLNKNAIWAIVYGDLMSYLMILFLLMLSFTLHKQTNIKEVDKIDRSLMQVQRVFGGEVDPEIEARAEKIDKEQILARLLKQKVEGGELGTEVSIIETEQAVSVKVGEGVLFDSGKAQLKEGAIPVLEGIAKTMVDVDNQIRVEGHTDSLPIKRGEYKSNWELSMARAYAVIKQLQGFGVDPRRISGVGYGEYRPVAPNNTREGRAKNRRIEISLVRTQ